MCRRDPPGRLLRLDFDRPEEQLLANDGDVRRRLNPQADAMAFDFEDFEHDLIVNNNAFADTTCENEHG
jgi:hypothetical protein